MNEEEQLLQMMNVQNQSQATPYDLMSTLQAMGPSVKPEVTLETRTKRPIANRPVTPQEVGAPLLSVASPRVPFTEQLIARQTQGLEQQRKGITDLEKQGSQFQQPQMSDFAKLLAATGDIVGGGDTFKGIMEQEQANKQRGLAYNQNIQKFKNDLTDKEIDLLRTQSQSERDDKKMEMEERHLRMKLAAERNKEGDKVGKDILKTKEAQTIQSQIDLSDSLQSYKDLVDTHGYNVAGADKQKIESAYADLKLKYKEAANLGALTGPDVAILEEAIKPLTGFGGLRGQVAGAVGLSGGAGGISTSLADAQKTLGTSFNNRVNTLRTAYGDSPVLNQWESKFKAPKTVDAEKAEYEALMKKKNSGKK